MEVVLFSLLNIWCIPILAIGATVFFIPFVAMTIIFGAIMHKIISKMWRAASSYAPRGFLYFTQTRSNGIFVVILQCSKIHLFSVLGVPLVHLCVMCGMAISKGTGWGYVLGNGVGANYCEGRGGVGDFNWRERVVILSWFF